MKMIPFTSRVGSRLLQGITYKAGQPIGLYRSWAILAITNHVLVRLAASITGCTAKQVRNYPYLVLGDDVVIKGEAVAMKYLEIINSLGVEISIQKSVTPSPKNGLEFASKIISKDGNLRPLPIILLTKPGLVYKFQFLRYLVDRILTDGLQRGPALRDLIIAVFGKRLSDKLGCLFIHYFFISHFMKIKKSDLERGLLPELFSSPDTSPKLELDQERRITLVEDLSTALNQFKLERC